MDQRRPCGAIAGRFCSGIMSEDDCDECIEFVNTCDECFSPGSNESDGWSDGPNGETLCDYCKAKYLADTAMHAAEMRGLDMQDAPERIWAWVYNLPYNKHNGYRCWTPFKPTFKPWVIHDWPGWKFWKSRTTEYYQNQTEYTRTDLCITEAECQRRIDAAVVAEREACAVDAEDVAKGLSDNEYDDMATGAHDAADTIRARGQK